MDRTDAENRRNLDAPEQPRPGVQKPDVGARMKPHHRLHTDGREWWTDSSPFGRGGAYTTGPRCASPATALRYGWRLI